VRTATSLTPRPRSSGWRPRRPTNGWLFVKSGCCGCRRCSGYEGSARNFRRLVADQKALWRKDNHRGRRPPVWAAGEYLVIDWAEAAPGLFVFCAVLAFSRWRFVRFAADQKATTTLAMITEALAAIGGVPAKAVEARTRQRGEFR
jgi:hypothetical protein